MCEWISVWLYMCVAVCVCMDVCGCVCACVCVRRWRLIGITALCPTPDINPRCSVTLKRFTYLTSSELMTDRKTDRRTGGDLFG